MVVQMEDRIAVVAGAAGRSDDLDDAIGAPFPGGAPGDDRRPDLGARFRTARAALLSGDGMPAYLLLADAVVALARLEDMRRAEEWGIDPHCVRPCTVGFGPSSLTAAERRVLEYLPTHLTLADIAARLYVSRNTVKSQVIAIYRKLGTSSRAGAVETATEAGILDRSSLARYAIHPLD